MGELNLVREIRKKCLCFMCFLSHLVSMLGLFYLIASISGPAILFLLCMLIMAAMLTNAKKYLLLQNRLANITEAWYVASGTLAHHSLFKSNDDPMITLTYFMARSVLEIGFYMGKM